MTESSRTKHKIRFGIIGCSSIAQKSVIPAIRNVQIVKLQMIGSRSPEKSEEVAKRFSCKLHGSYDEVLERDDVDAVYISLPISLQEKWVTKSARAKKHIICEKSVSTSYRSAKKMVLECKKNNVRLMEAFSFRFHPQHRQVSRIVESKKIGKPFCFSAKFGFLLPHSFNNFRFNKKLGGGSLNDLGCYIIYASRMLFQKEPNRIICNLHNDKKFGVDTKGSIYMAYPDDLIAYGAFGYENYFQSTYSVWGSNGVISLDWAFNIRKNKHATININSANKLQILKIMPTDQTKLMIYEFCKKLNEKTLTKNSFEDDLLCQARVMEAARQSNLSSLPVNLQAIK